MTVFEGSPEMRGAAFWLAVLFAADGLGEDGAGATGSAAALADCSPSSSPQAASASA
jgi:hypothetical protein